MYRVYCKCFKIRRKFDFDGNANLGVFLVHMFTCFVSCMIKGAKKRLGIRFNKTFHYHSPDRHPLSASFMSSVIFIEYGQSLVIFGC
jgi:hypothetical protein